MQKQTIFININLNPLQLGGSTPDIVGRAHDAPKTSQLEIEGKSFQTLSHMVPRLTRDIFE